MKAQTLIQLRSAVFCMAISTSLLFLELGTWVNILAVTSIIFFGAASIKLIKTAK